MSNPFVEPAVPAAVVEGTPTNAFNDQLNAIVNEQGAKKYETVEVALEALKHSQAHIPGLESQLAAKDSELATLREQLSQTESVQSLIDKHTASLGVPEITPQENVPEVQDVAALVTQALEKQQLAQTEEANFNSVAEQLNKAYGDKAAQAITEKAKQLNTTPAYLESLAKTNPTMLMSLLGAPATVATPAPTYGSVSLSSLTPQALPKLGRPEESLLAGAKPGAQLDFMKRVKEEVYRDLGVTI